MARINLSKLYNSIFLPEIFWLLLFMLRFCWLRIRQRPCLEFLDFGSMDLVNLSFVAFMAVHSVIVLNAFKTSLSAKKVSMIDLD